MTEPATQPMPSPAEETVSADTPCILVVDDSRVIRRAVAKILNNEFQLIEAEDGEAGWNQLVENERIQVVITDMEMPKLDGYALICRIRAADAQRVRDVPVIVITGANDDQTRERAYACGATDFVIKPLDGVQLLARTRAHARLDETTRQLTETAKSLEEQSAVDPLTELNSRRYFFQRGEQDLAYAKRRNGTLSVIRLDFDNFRAVYKQIGDEACDQLFVWLATILRAHVRGEDTPARIRGGEFAIIVPAVAHADAMSICDRIRVAVAATPFNHNGKAISVSVSIGLATMKQDGSETIDQLVERAERHLTLAKADGGNRINGGLEETFAAPEEAVVEQVVEQATEQSLPEMTLDLPSVDIADEITPDYTEALVQLLPVLEVCNKELNLGVDAAIQTIRERLGLVKQ